MPDGSDKQYSAARLLLAQLCFLNAFDSTEQERMLTFLLRELARSQDSSLALAAVRCQLNVGDLSGAKKSLELAKDDYLGTRNYAVLLNELSLREIKQAQ